MSEMNVKAYIDIADCEGNLLTVMTKHYTLDELEAELSDGQSEHIKIRTASGLFMIKRDIVHYIEVTIES